MLSFLTVIDTTFHLIIIFLFSEAMISSLQLYDLEKSFRIGKKPFNLALGMGPYFGPMRALEKGMYSVVVSGLAALSVSLTLRPKKINH